MSKELIEKERQLFRESMTLRRLDLSQTEWKQAQQIREQQNDKWHRAQFYKNFLKEVNKRNSKIK